MTDLEHLKGMLTRSRIVFLENHMGSLIPADPNRDAACPNEIDVENARDAWARAVRLCTCAQPSTVISIMDTFGIAFLFDSDGNLDSVNDWE